LNTYLKCILFIYLLQLIMDVPNFEPYLATAGGKITCLRCTAKSTRTHLQCGRPALKTSRTVKCQFHGGGATSGKRTKEGISRSAASVTKSGNFTKKAIEEQSRQVGHILSLEDAMHVLGMTTATRTRGRKPKYYKPLKTKEQVCQYFIDIEIHRVRGSLEDLKK
jgi:hypothetical protein